MLQIGLFFLRIDQVQLMRSSLLQDPEKDRVKGPENSFRMAAGLQKPSSHLCGGRPGKCENQNRGRIHCHCFDQISDPFHQYKCFSASGTGNNGTGPRHMMDGGFLCRIGFLFTCVTHLHLTKKESRIQE